MAVILGIDAGGTFTDGALIDAATGKVLRGTKTATLHHALQSSIHACLAAFSEEELRDLVAVCLSTTLATNALVEGHGGREGLILIGERPKGTLPSTQVVQIAGKMDILGRVQMPLDLEGAVRAAEQLRGEVDAVAVSGYASVRNPEMEEAVRSIMQERLGVPVVCAHELTGELGFYGRSVTAALNARLMPVICGLIAAVEALLEQRGITAPLRIVRGDGALMRAAEARRRPIETILSGPAASIAGGRFLSGREDCLIMDIGGTTTDLAAVSGGAARLRAAGASVGGWLTQVRAAEVYTVGLGGDSRIRLEGAGAIRIGPERAIPFCVAAAKEPRLMAQLQNSDFDGELEAVWPEGRTAAGNAVEIAVLGALQGGPAPVSALKARLSAEEGTALDAMLGAGKLRRIALTPTDLICAAGGYAPGLRQASEKILSFYAGRLGVSEEEAAVWLRTAVRRKLAGSILQAGLYFHSPDGLQETRSEAAELLLQGGTELLHLRPRLEAPLVAIGAPSAAWADGIREWMDAEILHPAHAEIAGAVGAAVGRRLEQAALLIRLDPVTKRYTLFAPDGRSEHERLEEATEAARRRGAAYTAARLGAGEHTVHEQIRDSVDAEGSFVERRIVVTASAEAGD